MLRPIDSNDFESLKRVGEVAVRVSVAESEGDAVFLIDDIMKSLEGWFRSGQRGFHRCACLEETLVGFIVVKDYWNLSHLFVLPQHQGAGIGGQLVDEAIESCRRKSPRQKIQLYSSDAAAGFYQRCGFERTGPGIERPGGCLPMEYRFDD